MGYGFQVNLARVFNCQRMNGERSPGQRIQDGKKNDRNDTENCGNCPTGIKSVCIGSCFAKSQNDRGVDQLYQCGMFTYLYIIDDGIEVSVLNRVCIIKGDLQINWLIIILRQHKYGPGAQK